MARPVRHSTPPRDGRRLPEALRGSPQIPPSTTEHSTMSNESWYFETRQIHAGQTADPTTGARALPIYQTTSFVFPTPRSRPPTGSRSQELGPIYTRIGNPTQEVVENRIAALEGGVGALLVASGQAAETLAILNIAEAGDHVVASPSPLRRHVQPAALHAAQARHRDDVRHRPARRAGVERRGPPEHQAVLRARPSPTRSPTSSTSSSSPGVAHEVGRPARSSTTPSRRRT